MSVEQLVATIDKSLVLELYKRGEKKELMHLGTFNLDVERSLERLLGEYGDAQVLRADEYKAYVLVYLNG